MSWNKGIKCQSLKLFSGVATTLCVCGRRWCGVGREGKGRWGGRGGHGWAHLTVWISDFVTVQFSCSVVSDSLQPHGLKDTRLPCPLPTPGVYPNPCPLSWWCHPAISSSIIPFSSHLQSFPAWGSFPMSQFFASGGQFSSVQSLSRVRLCDPMNRSKPGLPVHHQLSEFTQTHAHPVSDAIQPSHPRSSPSPPAPNPSQHQGLFQCVSFSHQVAKVLEFQL